MLGRTSAKPTWQLDAHSVQPARITDVSAVADPDTGVAVYESYPSGGLDGLRRHQRRHPDHRLGLRAGGDAGRRHQSGLTYPYAAPALD